MPLYEYRCENCGHTFEVIQKFSDPPAEHCPSCGKGPVLKLMSSPAIQFKGTGWYITDYARKNQVGSGKSEPGSSESSEKSDKSEKTQKSEKSEKSGGSETKSEAAKPASSGGDSGKKE